MNNFVTITEKDGMTKIININLITYISCYSWGGYAVNFAGTTLWLDKEEYDRLIKVITNAKI